ncbi:aldehyde dehydrogenase [Nocardioides sp. Soil774]|uniref:aldehyde dehydrogenase family protein n=1 Tax=Nocardioides sp. Soil774 TaxID=1736408 RepID=UPI000701284B|nr:aldehyde dehydrogenase family protein [Nocardioides sp. Soil774]KRE94203.1 aldehyde dehydrogenase [Nocardioides sp. Soil774]
MPQLALRTLMVLAGGETAAIDDDWIEVLEPATGAVLSEVPRGRAADVDAATQAAAQAFPSWRAVSATERGRALNRLADLLDHEREELAQLLCRETGNAIRTQSRPEIGSAIDILRYFAGVAQETKGETVPLGPGIFNYTVREPMGVVGAMTPWNAPVQLAVVKAAAAIVTGNTVVLKASEEAPLTVLRVARLAQDVLPPGVLNVVTGLGPEAGAALLEDRKVAKLSFTGSTRVGRVVMRAAADRIIPVSLELGGKSPAVVCADADDDETARGVVNGMRFHRQGQSCTAGSRLYVHDAVYDSFVARLRAHVAELVVGDPMDERSDMGSLINQTQYDRVRGYVRGALSAGGELLAGTHPDESVRGAGYYLDPILLGGLAPDAPAACEEIFGPVMVISRWRELDEVVGLCNDSPYGLAAFVWTKDVSTALRLAHSVEAGWVQVNRGLGQLPGLSYGGVKASGIGGEFSLETAVEAFTHRKTVTIGL